MQLDYVYHVQVMMIIVLLVMPLYAQLVRLDTFIPMVIVQNVVMLLDHILVELTFVQPVVQMDYALNAKEGIMLILLAHAQLAVVIVKFAIVDQHVKHASQDLC